MLQLEPHKSQPLFLPRVLIHNKTHKGTHNESLSFYSSSHTPPAPIYLSSVHSSLQQLQCMAYERTYSEIDFWLIFYFSSVSFHSKHPQNQQLNWVVTFWYRNVLNGRNVCFSKSRNFGVELVQRASFMAMLHFFMIIWSVCFLAAWVKVSGEAPSLPS